MSFVKIIKLEKGHSNAVSTFSRRFLVYFRDGTKNFPSTIKRMGLNKNL